MQLNILNKIFITFFLIFINIYPQKLIVLESNEHGLKLSINFENAYSLRDTTILGNNYQYITNGNIENKIGEPILPKMIFKVGVPQNSKVELQIVSSKSESYISKTILPYSDSSKIYYDKKIYTENKFYPELPCEIIDTFSFRYVMAASVQVSPFQYNPITRKLNFTKELLLHVKFLKLVESGYAVLNDILSEEYLRNNVINYNTAKSWINYIPKLTKANTEALSSNKEYFKIYVKEKGVYRITFNQLLNSNPLITDGIESERIIITNGGHQIPIEIFDGGDGIFNANDYIQFVGYPPEPTPYCRWNIYNMENVYWLSYNPDIIPFHYKVIDGFPKSWNYDIQTNTKILHFEKDSIYERLGYANDDRRDYWYWSKIIGENKIPKDIFNLNFAGLPNLDELSMSIKLRINMHGITTYPCTPGHRVSISLNNIIIGNAEWDGQNSYIYEKEIPINSINLNTSSNNLKIISDGDVCGDLNYDELRFNWCDVEYQRYNRINADNYNFTSPKEQRGLVRYWLWKWKSDNMKIYIPDEGKVITNPQILNDPDSSVLFVDTVNNIKEYFCVSDDYFLTPDSIVSTVLSDLKNTNNSADYIIITHEKFKASAQRLADFRSTNLDGFANPKIMIVDIQSIYDEFSNGLLDPFAIRSFLSYAFTNWKTPAPSYVVLMGDMSYDYRGIDKTSRRNFIPSIPYHVKNYGQAVSDNSIAAVSGRDIAPDIAIGRLSCETETEAAVIVDKIINYSADGDKVWKDKLLLIAAGRDTSDERRFRFNEESILLENNFILPRGHFAEKIFRFPDAANILYQGGRSEIHNALNSGVLFVNFYGHGGGYQWDDVFYNEDIFQLQNNNKLPFISSITCYTAHFDNQDVFGERFLKSSGKGCIGFWGSSAITLWTPGIKLNKAFYKQVLTNNELVIGKAILYANNDFTITDRYDEDMLAVSTYLGDPAQRIALPEKPDFSVIPEDIALHPEIPSTSDTVSIKIKMNNYGRLINNDSLWIMLTAGYSDTTEVISIMKLSCFGNADSLQAIWFPKKEGNVSITINLNVNQNIAEPDYSDNLAVKTIYIYNVTEPSVIKPINGLCTSDKQVEFLIADPGTKIQKTFSYNVEIDTSTSFNSPALITAAFPAVNGVAGWRTSELAKGIYFWRVKVSGENLSTRWSSTNMFSVQDTGISGYYVHGAQLKLFKMENAKYSDSLKAIVQDNTLQPPKPSNGNLLYDIQNTQLDSLKGITAITTDGTYIYCGHISYYSGGSKIYKIGTGFSGTQRGKNYGVVSNYSIPIKHQMFYHSDGFIYIAAGKAFQLIKLNPLTGDTVSIKLQAGLLNSSDGKVKDGDYYITSDGKYVYNVAVKDSLGNYNYKIRVIDPANGWKLVKDINPVSSGYHGFSGFFIAGNYFFPYENYTSGYMRRINLVTGNFEDEWITSTPFQPYYSWCYDRINNVVYSSHYRQSYKPKLSVFKGTFKSTSGKIITQEIGPAAKWKRLDCSFDPKFSGSITGIVQGFNNAINKWDDLFPVLSYFSLNNVSAKKYTKLRVTYSFSDSSINQNNIFALKKFHIDYQPPPEIVISGEDVSFSPDSVLKGDGVDITGKIRNLGYSDADSVVISFLLNDNQLLKMVMTINSDSAVFAGYHLETKNLPKLNKIKIKASLSSNEYADFNNEAEKDLIIYNDIEKPELNITFDGEEIVDGDYISSHPQIIITLKDNRPFIMGDTSIIRILQDGKALSFQKDSLTSVYGDTTYTIRWYPRYEGGIHTIRIFAKDASGNHFDSSGYKVSFLVDNNNNILNVFNYPNPFRDETHITFNLTGSELPEEISVRVFTVAGRLVRAFTVSGAGLKFGFNKIFYDGKDQDGNSLANGVYFFKLSVRNKNKYINIINKFAKVK